MCSVHDDRATAISGAKWLLTQYLAQQPHIAKASGVDAEIVQKVKSIIGWPASKEQIHQAMQFVPDEFVLRISATGTPQEARAKVREYMDRGCTCPILYPLGDPLLMIDTFEVILVLYLWTGEQRFRGSCLITIGYCIILIPFPALFFCVLNLARGLCIATSR